MKKNILLSFLFSAVYFLASAQTKIDTDRPDQTESPFTVPKQWMQFEMGLLRQAEKNIYPGYLQWKDIYLQHPVLLTKYGVSKWAELRLITGIATYKLKDHDTTSFKESGLETVQLGGKVNFFKEKGLRPKTSLIAHYDFGSLRTIRKDTIDGLNFRFTMQHTLSSKVSLSYNLGMEWRRFGFPPVYIYTFSPGFNFSDKWYAYIEAFGFIWQDEQPENSIDGGIAYYVNDNLKIDASAGFGINKKAPDNYFALGASFRFKTSNK